MLISSPPFPKALVECESTLLSYSKFGDPEMDSDRFSFDVVTTTESAYLKDNPILANESKKKPNPGDCLDQRPGWPLLRRTTSADLQTLHAREFCCAMGNELADSFNTQNPRMERNDVFN